MPVVKSVQHYFGTEPTMLKINCDSRGKFTAKLPEYAVKVLGSDSVAGDTLDECERAWKKASDEYKNAKTTTKRVICYEIEAQAKIYRNDKCIAEFDDKTFEDGLILSIWADVFDERCTLKPTGDPIYDYDEVESSLPNTLTRTRHNKMRHSEQWKNKIPWTLEREQFFAKVAFAMEAVILELKKLDEPKDVLKIADSGRLLEFK